MSDQASQIREPVPPPARVIAGCFAMSAFSIAIISGIFAGNSATMVLSRALVCLFGAYLLGLLAGEILAFAIRDHLRRYLAEHPVPDSDIPLDEIVGELRVDKLSESKPNIAANSADA